MDIFCSELMLVQRSTCIIDMAHIAHTRHASDWVAVAGLWTRDWILERSTMG